MKRYLIFAGNYWETESIGWDNFKGDFDTTEECKKEFLEMKCYEWSHVVDTVTKTKIQLTYDRKEKTKSW